MATKQEFVAAVLSWENTPFHHLGRLKGVGVDCVGLAVGALSEIGVEVQDLPLYPHSPIDKIFDKQIDIQTAEVAENDMQLGDLIKLRFGKESQHLAIVTQIEPTVLITHAFATARKVVTTTYDDLWKQRVVGIRRIPGLE